MDAFPFPVYKDSLHTSSLPESHSDSRDISDYLKTLIIHGDDPERPRNSENPKYPSRSETLFRVTCDLLRHGCDDEVICGILLNPEHRIPESVLEKNNPTDYAVKQVRSAKEVADSSWPKVNGKGFPIASYENAHLALRRLGVSVEHDLFRNRMRVSGNMLQVYQGDLSDNLCVILRQIILDKFEFDPGKEHIRDAAHALCLENPVHPVLEYIGSLQWDGSERLETMLIKYFGAEDTPLNRAISRIMMIAAVRRVRSPGAKYDTIVVLEGEQGSGKSSALKILAGSENFSDQNILSLDAKSQMEAMEGVWIFEIGELEGLRRTEVSKVKAFASRDADKARPAYGRFTDTRKRQTVFVGTTNDRHYLKDETGTRRFLPVKTAKIDLEALKHDRDQLWAEAALYEAQGENITLPEPLWPAAGKEQEHRMEHDGWEDLLREMENGVVYEINGYHRISSTDILTNVLEIPKERQQKHHSSRLGTLMRKLGWDGPKTITLPHSKKLKGYERLDKWERETTEPV